jgi:hypothetical protein
MRVMSHQERIAEFDRQAEARARARDAAAAAARQRQQAAAGPGPGQQQQEGGGKAGQQRGPPAWRSRQQPRSAGSSGGGGSGAGADPGSSGEEDEEASGGGEGGGAGPGGIPMEELLARSQLEDASLNLVMEAMWAANVVDIQSTLTRVGVGAAGGAGRREGGGCVARRAGGCRLLSAARNELSLPAASPPPRPGLPQGAPRQGGRPRGVQEARAGAQVRGACSWGAGGGHAQAALAYAALTHTPAVAPLHL